MIKKKYIYLNERNLIIEFKPAMSLQNYTTI